MTNSTTVRDRAFKELASSLTSMLQTTSFTPANVPLLITMLMRLVSGYPKLSGAQKKELVLTVLKQEIQDHVRDPQLEATLTLLVDTVGPELIEVVYSVDTRKLRVQARKLCCGK
jgi:hypothetical protein